MCKNAQYSLRPSLHLNQAILTWTLKQNQVETNQEGAECDWKPLRNIVWWEIQQYDAFNQMYELNFCILVWR